MAEPWTDAQIREGFIDDGGLSEYHDPINGAREQRRIGGRIFDEWLVAHDREVIEKCAATVERMYPLGLAVMGDAPAKIALAIRALSASTTPNGSD